MSTPVTVNPAYQSGIAAITDSFVTCLNNATDYLYVGDAIAEDVQHETHSDPAGQRLGSHTQSTNRFTGNLNLQKRFVTDADVRGGYIVNFGSRAKYYIVASKPTPANAKNKTIPFSFTAEQETNPILTTCLGTTGNGQTLVDTGAASSYTKTIAAVNTRAGATKAFALSAWLEEYPVATVPTGLTIGASTGTFAAAAVATGTYYLKIVLTDSVTGQPDIKGVGFLILTIA